MSVGRRKVSIDSPTAWVFNRMAASYTARPAYPRLLVQAIAELLGSDNGRIGDLGAGIGHLALPLAARGFDVVAIEPAQAMLEQLRGAANAAGLGVRALHAAAEALPLEPGSLELVVIADALHFLDAELVGAESRRVLVPRGTLAVVISEFANTPFMRDISSLLWEATPRRPRLLAPRIAELSAAAGVQLTSEQRFRDETPVDAATIEGILRSISLLEPALNSTRLAALHQSIRTLDHAPVWSRILTLRSGRKRG